MGKFISKILFLLPALIIISCSIREKNNTRSTFNDGFNLIHREAYISEVDSILTNEISLGEILYKTQKIGDQLFIADSRFCNIMSYDLKNGNSKFFTDSLILGTKGCPHSITLAGDTVMFFYSHGTAFAKLLKDSIIEVVQFDFGKKDLHFSHSLPIKLLSNGNLLVPLDNNLDPTTCRPDEKIVRTQMLSSSTDLQNIFAIFNSKGRLIKVFGNYPEIYSQKDVRRNSFRKFHYSVLSDKVYITFALTPTVKVFDLEGTLLESLNFNLSEFECFEGAKNYKKISNAIDGFAVEELRGGKVNYYFKTVHPRKRKNYFYKIDTHSETTTEYDVFYPVGMMMSLVKNGEWVYMNMPWDDDPLILKTYQFED